MMIDDLCGKTINGYEIIHQVGRGGMATVYLALQQSMNRKVALKFLPSSFINDDTYLQRFEREAKIVAGLEHRNIVPVYDFGEYRDQPYIAMRYLPDGSVEELLVKGSIPSERVLSIIEQVAAALDYAHQQGIIHRDLKPSNILLDDAGGAFITDFSIARILGDGASTITTQGIVGTPSYMSPEQARGEDLDGRSDVYALGVMLFEVLTGRRPFESDTPYSIAVMHVTTAPPYPSDINPNVTTALDKMILRSLKKQRELRYATAGELANALREALAQPESTEDREQKLIPAAEHPRPAVSQLSLPTGLPGQKGSRASSASAVLPAPLLQPIKPEPARQDRRKGGMWRGMAAGGFIGCVLLVALLALALLVLVLISLQDSFAGEESVATSPENSAAGTVAESDPMQLTQRTLNAAADSTLTGNSQTRDSDASSSSPILQPVGVRNKPTLNSALQAASGTLVFFDKVGDSEAKGGSFEIVTRELGTWEDRVLTANFAESTYPQPSPDGRWIAFQSDRDGDFEIYVMNRSGGQMRQLSNNDFWDRLPAWSPDGGWIVYSSDIRDDQTFDLYRVRPDGSDAQLVYSDGQRNSHARYSPDGNYLVFTSGSNARSYSTWEIRLLDLRSGQSQLLTQNDFRDSSPTFSPDSQNILYVTTIGGNRALASMSIAGAERKILFTGPGRAWAASFSPDGNFIAVTATYNDEDQLFLMGADGGNVQQITDEGGAYASWIPSSARD